MTSPTETTPLIGWKLQYPGYSFEYIISISITFQNFILHWRGIFVLHHDALRHTRIRYPQAMAIDIDTTKVDGKNNEWFKVFNLSIGVEHRLSNRWSLQAEPFFKAPLGDIGEQGVRLSSAGIFFGLKYKIN